MIQDFINSYIECALWASSDIDDEGKGPESLTGYVLAPETHEAMIADATEFYNQHHGLWQDVEDYGDTSAGHDYWLTRCGHGAGFWDRGIGDVGDELTKLAEADGNRDLYIGDDGLIYQA
jgi:hypothetical protein